MISRGSLPAAVLIVNANARIKVSCIVIIHIYSLYLALTWRVQKVSSGPSCSRVIQAVMSRFFIREAIELDGGIDDSFTQELKRDFWNPWKVPPASEDLSLPDRKISEHTGVGLFPKHVL